MSNYDILHWANKLGIPHFRGVFMRNDLPKNAYKYESGIVNLDDSDGIGTHWVAYSKENRIWYYYDSYGNSPPPNEMVKYLGNNCFYNRIRHQKKNEVICGQLSLKFLCNKWKVK